MLVAVGVLPLAATADGGEVVAVLAAGVGGGGG